jgi:hypothetical protein
VLKNSATEVVVAAKQVAVVAQDPTVDCDGGWKIGSDVSE